MQQNLDSVRSEKGVSLLELAIFLPFIILFIAGIIDYGSALREIQAISSASREGARIGASHARADRPAHGMLPCNNAHAAAEGTCSGATSSEFEIDGFDAVSTAARKAACSFINNSGLSGADWYVKAEVPPLVHEDGADFQVVTVNVSKDAHARACILCWDRLLEGFQSKAESTFTLESGCS